MKKLIYCILGLIVCNFIAYFPLEKRIEYNAKKAVEDDSAKYREEAIHTIDSIFDKYEGTNFGCVLYYNMLPNFQFVPDSKRDEVFPNKELNELRNLSDLNSIYCISPDVVKELETTEIRTVQNSIWLANIDRGERGIKPLNGYKAKQPAGFWQSGWAIGYVHRKSEDSYSCFIVYPSMVGFFDDNPHSSIEISEYIEDALDYLVNDRKSFLRGYVSNKYIFDYLSLATRESIGARLNHFEEDNTEIRFGGISDCISYNNCRVYIRSTKTKTYTLKYCNDYDEGSIRYYVNEHNERLIKVLSLIGGGLTIILIILLFVNYQRRKKVNRTIIERIRINSNPKRFMKKYDEKKIEAANYIYNKAMSISEEDEAAIIDLCDQLENDLGISLVENQEIKKLLKMSNPKNFTKPYNAEKLERANRIYAYLQKEKIYYRKFVEIRKEVESLYS